jgi:hypothetical protein
MVVVPLKAFEVDWHDMGSEYSIKGYEGEVFKLGIKVGVLMVRVELLSFFQVCNKSD